MHVICTAGHVDHGKSKLVEALTGIDPDRLKEEKEREMTIDLGFAWLTLPSGQKAGIVDVPGHEDFVDNMLAGVGGIDVALFVVAADEGVMPQTKEHLDILNLLQVRHGVVALTKVDLVDEELIELVKLEVEELLEGTTLADVPIVPVSSKTGRGLSDLVRELDRVLESTPPPRDLGRPRLSIDRVFSITGFGTVVTGTLIDGHLEVGQEVEIMPRGLKARIRGLETHKERIERAVPGSRVAINLAGVSKGELKRGDVVAPPGQLASTELLDVELHMLSSAPAPLRHNSSLRFFAGAAKIMARARIIGAEAIAPGQTGWAQLCLSEPTAVVRGDRFIIRRPSPPMTIGGGRILDAHPRRRYRRFRPEVIEHFEALAYGKPEEVLRELLRAHQPCTMPELIRLSGWEEKAVVEALERSKAEGKVIALSGGRLLPEEGWRRLLSRICSSLRDYHRRHPLRRGMPREELRTSLHLPAGLFDEVVAQAVKEGKLLEEGTVVRLAEHEVKFSPAQQERVDKLLDAFAARPYTPPSVAECEEMVGTEVFNALVEGGKLVKVSKDVVFLAETYEEMVERIIERLRKEGSITVAQVRDMFSSSRRYILALMEHLDEVKVTKRVGDERVLR